MRKIPENLLKLWKTEKKKNKFVFRFLLFYIDIIKLSLMFAIIFIFHTNQSITTKTVIVIKIYFVHRKYFIDRKSQTKVYVNMKLAVNKSTKRKINVRKLLLRSKNHIKFREPILGWIYINLTYDNDFCIFRGFFLNKKIL